MARSIKCSVCKNDKEPGRDNESCCKKCKSDRGKAKRAQRRLEEGLRPIGSGRSPNCYTCGILKENPRANYCKACTSKRDNEWRLKTGRTKKHQTGLCPCGQPRSTPRARYCAKCGAAQSKRWRELHGWSEAERERINERQRLAYESVSKGRIRRKGSLINGVPVLCKECDLIDEGWCKECDEHYQELKREYDKNGHYTFKQRVRALTRSYIKAGILVRQPCEVCGATKKIEAHHDDYTKPMDIRWLCKQHHDEFHSLNFENEDLNHDNDS